MYSIALFVLATVLLMLAMFGLASLGGALGTTPAGLACIAAGLLFHKLGM